MSSKVVPENSTITDLETARSNDVGSSINVSHANPEYLGVSHLLNPEFSSGEDSPGSESANLRKESDISSKIDDEEESADVVTRLRRASASTRSHMTDDEDDSPKFARGKIHKIPTIKELVREETETMTHRCRICFEEGDIADLIQPCKCSGSLRNIHRACLKKWLSGLSGNLELAECEICKTQFNVKVERNERRVCICSQDSVGEFFFSPQIIVLGVLLFITALMFFLSFVIAQNSGPMLIVMRVTTFIAASAVFGILFAHIFTTFTKKKVRKTIKISDLEAQ
mmetsp:Transcript_9037/g.9787  ORF Transcript_9037/g.9787 Transcript_9037/m.9787 type:complete len:284 (-) Transcript_9037:317-1168(-)|eukprot:CAMPEP_0115005776 /NCGR_PEP_ID=MMETSP0216-20121206/20090_1 /TAXON_ID=223996 /ORGANISM="Protocruzia adherens, Strain Boccale" /LENGTH=283 /DNA_ID=CAMNT_0002372201 /DNA_START=222 /DNA_END=1073 /DNA_ORIENTATION=-